MDIALEVQVEVLLHHRRDLVHRPGGPGDRVVVRAVSRPEAEPVVVEPGPDGASSQQHQGQIDKCLETGADPAQASFFFDIAAAVAAVVVPPLAAAAEVPPQVDGKAPAQDRF